jgi:hypothetical protein
MLFTIQPRNQSHKHHQSTHQWSHFLARCHPYDTLSPVATLPSQIDQCNSDISPNGVLQRLQHYKCNKEQLVVSVRKAWIMNRDDEDLWEKLSIRNQARYERYKPLPWKFCGTSCGDMRMTKGWPKYLGMWAKTNELSESIMINKGRRV